MTMASRRPTGRDDDVRAQHANANANTNANARAGVGAMTMAMRALGGVTPSTGKGVLPRWLRLGVVSDARIVEELTLRTPSDVTAGPREKDTVIVPDARASQLIFTRADTSSGHGGAGGGYALVLAPGMRGRLATAGGVHDIEALIVEGHTSVALDERARGRIDLGGTAILFQIIVARPDPVRPSLPVAVRGGFAAGIDWRFSAFVTTSFLAFLGGALVLEASDYAIADTADVVPTEIARLILEEPEPPPPDPYDMESPVDDGAPDEIADATDTTPTDASRPDHGGPRHNDDRARPTLAEVEDIRQAALLQIGALARDSGSLRQLLDGTGMTTDAASVLRDVDGASTTADSSMFTARGPNEGVPSGQDIGRMVAVSGHGIHAQATEGVEIVEVDVTGFVDVEDGTEEGGTGVFDMRLVTREVQRRVRAIGMCYEHEMRNRPDMRGKVTMGFTVEPSGRVSGVRAVDNTTGSSALGACIGRSLSTIRFRTGPEGGDVRVTFPFVFAPQG